jgi:hypothetical protein
MTVRLASVIAAGEPSAWVAVGFAIEGDRVPFGNGAIEFDRSSEAQGLVGLRLAGLEQPADALAGVPLQNGEVAPAMEHPNGCYELDHFVILTPDLEHTSSEVTRVLGLERRRLRETATVRQAFHRFPERGCIVELVESDRVRSPRLWGLVANTPDLVSVAAELGEHVIAPPKPAVQQDRLIATFRSEAGLGVPVALMTPQS